jgi:hypothetical protein
LIVVLVVLVIVSQAKKEAKDDEAFLRELERDAHNSMSMSSKPEATSSNASARRRRN